MTQDETRQDQSGPTGTGKPAVLSVNWSGLPDSLKKLDRWVLWKLELPPGGSKWTKVPYYGAEMKKASTTNGATWHSFREVEYLHGTCGHGDGIGFVFGDSAGLIGWDFDAKDSAMPGEVVKQARALGSYMERSVGGDGFHVIGIGTLPAGGRHRSAGGRYEVYSDGRFFTMSGHHTAGTPEDVVGRGFQARSDALYGAVFGASAVQSLTDQPVPARPEDVGAWRTLIGGLPNPDWIDRGQYIGMCHAIAGCLGESGRDTFISWAGRWTAGGGQGAAYDSRVYDSCLKNPHSGAIELMNKTRWLMGQEAGEDWLDRCLGSAAVLAYRQAEASLEFGGDSGAATPAVSTASASSSPKKSGSGPRFETFRSLAGRIVLPEFLLAGLIEEGELNYIGGAPNVGKSAFALGFQLASAAGLATWMGLRIKPAVPVYLAQEAGTSMPARVQAWCQRHSVRMDSLPGLMLTSRFDLTRASDAEVLARGVLSGMASLGSSFDLTPFQKVDGRVRVTVTIDTQAASLSGVDEDRAGEVQGFLNALRTALIDGLRSEMCVTVVVTHHTPKADDRQLRGSGAQMGSASCVVMLARSSDWPGYVEVFPGKAREAPGGLVVYGKPVGEVVRNPVTGVPLTDEAGQTRRIVVFEHVRDIAADMASAGDPAVLDILIGIRDRSQAGFGTSSNQAAEMAGGGRRQDRLKLIKKLAEQGLIENRNPDSGTADYRITEPGRKVLEEHGVFESVTDSDKSSPF